VEALHEADSAASSQNRYAILARLATGGMAELFLARTASAAGVERYVVLKRVLASRLGDTHFVAMFLDEARLAAQLQHPNIAQVFDAGKLGDSFFFSMEYVHGVTVRELQQRAKELDQPIPIGCTLTIAASAAAGLHHAHERIGLDGKPLGIVHRDVSPSNLMVSYEGNVKLVDFGVAKARRRSVETQTGTVKGKIGYLSPEQCRGRASDRRGDLFSLGVVIWELLVGDRLYKRDSDYDAMEAIVHATPPPPSRFRKDVPRELDAIVMRLLAKAPGDRYQTADELHDELERVADQRGLRISNAALKRYLLELFGKRPEPWVELQQRDAVPEVVTVSAAAMPGGDTQLTVLDVTLSNLLDLTIAAAPTAPRAITTAPPARRRRWLIAATVIAAAGAASGAAWWGLGRADTQRPGVAPAPVTAPPPAQPAPPVAAPRAVDVKARPAETPVAPIRESSPPPRAHSQHADDPTTLRGVRAGDVIARCAQPRVLAANASACTLAACQDHDARAPAWATRVPASRRAAIAAQCAHAGTPLEDSAPPPPPPKSCDDPMECRK